MQEKVTDIDTQAGARARLAGLHAGHDVEHAGLQQLARGGVVAVQQAPHHALHKVLCGNWRQEASGWARRFAGWGGVEAVQQAQQHALNKVLCRSQGATVI